MLATDWVTFRQAPPPPQFMLRLKYLKRTTTQSCSFPIITPGNYWSGIRTVTMITATSSLLFKHVIWNASWIIWNRSWQKAYRHTQDSTCPAEPELPCKTLAAQGTVELSRHRSWAHCYSCTEYTRSSTMLSRSSTRVRPLHTCHSVLQPVTVFTSRVSWET
jgi:hypothetical protein